MWQVTRLTLPIHDADHTVINTLACKIWIDMGNYNRILEFHISIQILHAKVYMFRIPRLIGTCAIIFTILKKNLFFLSSCEIHFDQILMRFFNRK